MKDAVATKVDPSLSALAGCGGRARVQSYIQVLLQLSAESPCFGNDVSRGTERAIRRRPMREEWQSHLALTQARGGSRELVRLLGGMLPSASVVEDDGAKSDLRLMQRTGMATVTVARQNSSRIGLSFRRQRPHYCTNSQTQFNGISWV